MFIPLNLLFIIFLIPLIIISFLSVVTADSNQDIKSKFDNKLTRKGTSTAFYQRLISLLILIPAIILLTQVLIKILHHE